MSLEIPQGGKKEKEREKWGESHLAGTCLPDGGFSCVESKYSFTGSFRKYDSICESPVENCCSQKSRKQLLAKARCDYVRMLAGNTVCPPDHHVFQLSRKFIC